MPRSGSRFGSAARVVATDSVSRAAALPVGAARRIRGAAPVRQGAWTRRAGRGLG
ncbi:MAG: hypothetical protein U5L11_14095 [Arhodomonas sp.]|nr:hypothetical protein [Arhodomonas sp.]